MRLSLSAALMLIGCGADPAEPAPGFNSADSVEITCDGNTQAVYFTNASGVTRDVTASAQVSAVTLDIAGTYTFCATPAPYEIALNIAADVTIRGEGSAQAEFSGGDSFTPIVIDTDGISVTLENILIEGGLATETPDGMETAGGGLYCNAESTLSLEDVTIQLSSAHDGAGAYIRHCAFSAHSSWFVSNTGLGDDSRGGGLFLYNSDATLTSSSSGSTYSSASMNHATRGGGIFAAGESTLNMGAYSLAMDNTADGSGGGLFLQDSIADLSDAPIMNNRAGGYGGGLIALGSTVAVNGTGFALFSNNSAAGGGGILLTRSTATISGAQIDGNDGGEDTVGGGLLLLASTVSVTDTTFDNTDDDVAGVDADGEPMWTTVLGSGAHTFTCDAASGECSSTADNDGDGFVAFEDCDDTDDTAHPDATEERGNDVDEDCSGSAAMIWTPIAGGLHTCALSEDGSIECWDSNDIGGDNHGQSDDHPTTSGWAAVSAGGYHTCALSEDGSIACWGRDDNGQSSKHPTTSGWTDITAGMEHSCALSEDGSIACWGTDAEGQSSTHPTTSGWISVSAGGYHTCALGEDGSIACWGVDKGTTHDMGQVTDQPTTSGWTTISAGTYHTCALSEGGSIECWGADSIYIDYGQSDNHPTTSGWKSISSGGLHSCAMDEDGRYECWGITWGRSEPGWEAIATGGIHNCVQDAEYEITCRQVVDGISIVVPELD